MKYLLQCYWLSYSKYIHLDRWKFDKHIHGCFFYYVGEAFAVYYNCVHLSYLWTDIHSGDLFRFILCIKIPILCITKVLKGKTLRALNNSSVGALYKE